MRYIVFFFLLSITACQCSKAPQRTPEELQQYIQQVRARQAGPKTDSVQTIQVTQDSTPPSRTIRFATEFFKEKGVFYRKHLEFEWAPDNNLLTVRGQSCDLVYKVTGSQKGTENKVTFSAYTEFQQWFSTAAIQRVNVTIYAIGDGYQVALNNLMFYTTMPPISAASPLVTYKVKKGDTATSIARQKGVQITCLSKTVNLRVGETIKIRCE